MDTAFTTTYIGRKKMVKGLYSAIHAKRASGAPMRKVGEKGAPTAKDFKNAAKTAKNKRKKVIG